MVNKRVQVRYEDSDIEEDSDNWSDEAEDVSDADSDAPSERPAAKPRSMGATRKVRNLQLAEEESDGALNSSEEDDDISSGNGEGEQEEGEDVTADIAAISFGALAKAQRSLKRKRDEPEDGLSDQSDSKPEVSNGRDPRNAARLAEIKGRLQALPAESKSSFAESLRKAREKRNEKESRSKRTSKHAPTEMSSKRAVSRRRIVVDIPTDTTRDPRFDRVGQSGAVNMDKIEKNYDFLDDYRDSEIKALRQEAAKEKNPIRKQELEKTLQSLESKRHARKRRLEHDKILAEHKKKERDSIKQGKKPFYLKKSEQKKIVLTTQFANMGEKQRSRVIEKKRKKVASKEKKRMPWSRRTAGGPED